MDFFPITLKAGQLFLAISLLISLWGLFLSLKSLISKKKDNNTQEKLRNMERFLFITVGMTCIVMIIALVRGDFFIEFVAEHSNSLLPLIFKITALWGGQDGSIIFWTFLLVLQLNISGRKPIISYIPIFFSLSFFLFLSLFISKAFKFIYPPPSDGRELNPLLQHFGMILHPVFLYLGLTGTIIPFSLYVAEIFERRENDTEKESNLKQANVLQQRKEFSHRRWSIFTWSFLTIGIIIGGWWAYSELGWGGYWAWDPVENVSLIPWLSLTAFIHTSMIEQKFRSLKTLNFILIFLTFLMSMMGTFLVRTGLFISVHSFVQDPSLGIAFLIFIAMMTGFGVFIALSPNATLSKERRKLRINSALSREFFILVGTVIFISMWVAVAVGTVYPVIYESITGDKISFGKPFFNRAFAPLSLLLLGVMGIGQKLPWGEGKHIKSKFLLPTGMSFLSFPITFYTHDFYTALGVSLCIFGISVILSEWIFERKFYSSRFFAMVAHLGFFIMALGIVFSQLRYKEKEFLISPGEEVEFGRYKIKLTGIEPSHGSNWQGIRALFEVSKDGNSFKIFSEKRKYFTWEEPTTEAGIRWGILKDFYIVFVKLEDGKLYIKVWDNPLVSFVWIGTAIIFFGGLGVFFTKKPKK